MKNNDSQSGLFNRALDLQCEINDLAAEYFAVSGAPDPRIQRLAAKFAELRAAQAALADVGRHAPNILTRSADEVAAALMRHGVCERVSTPTTDPSRN